MDSTYRCFAAVDLSEELRAAAAEVLAGLRAAVPSGVTWVRPEQLHATIKFYGAVPAARRAELEGALADACCRAWPARLALAGVGTFPPRGTPRVVWLGIRDEDGALANLHACVEQLSEGYGYPRESRAFRPHLTLGRVRPERGRSNRNARRLEALAPALERWRDRELGVCPVDELVLYHSELGPEGARYTPLARFPLGVDVA
jgi:2'-5' RNA ligase